MLEPIFMPLFTNSTPTQEEPSGNVEAQAALRRADRLAKTGHHEEALEELTKLRELLPRLTDRIAMLEGDYRMEMGPDDLACRAYDEAASSPLSSLSARARIAEVRCLLTIDDPGAEKAMTSLLRRYPRLPQAVELKLIMARDLEEDDRGIDAASIYRGVDFRYPGSDAAREARERLAELASKGVELEPYTVFQRLSRLEKLLRTGPLDMAREELAALKALELPRNIVAQIAGHEAKLARREGRFEEARALLEKARGAGSEDAEEALQREKTLARASATRDQEQVRRSFKRLIGGRPLAKQPTGRLYFAIRMAARADLEDEVNQALDVLLKRRRVPPSFVFQIGVAASGVGDDDRVARLFGSVKEHPTIGVAARYHAARALERLDRLEEALEEYQQVIALDDEETPFYGFWARQREQVIAATLRERDGGEVDVNVPEAQALHNLRSDAGSCSAFGRGRGPEIAEKLRPLAEEHGQAYPWLWRAVELLELDQLQDAADELHEAYLAHSDSRGRQPQRAGLEAVFRGGKALRHQASPQALRGRRALNLEDFTLLAEVSADVGDHGLAVRFGGWQRADERPRAYENAVRCSAARHGIDPNLLFAVMRVESVYNPRIISYAGAIGLMQIMPRTGAFIAHQQDYEGFTVDQLLEPELNIDFAAWYLSSLIERFDGRVPLAVAAYNGGPHNVRLWLQDYSQNMPLETFLETIPFGQTHRYVRRVLTHYEVYRAQLDLPVEPMDTTIPELEPDTIAF